MTPDALMAVIAAVSSLCTGAAVIRKATLPDCHLRSLIGLQVFDFKRFKFAVKDWTRAKRVEFFALLRWAKFAGGALVSRRSPQGEHAPKLVPRQRF